MNNENELDKKAIKTYPLNPENVLNFNYHTSFENPFIKPLKVIYENGKPIRHAHHIFILHKENKYLLGSLIFTIGGRIVFYPGYENLNLTDPQLMVSDQLIISLVRNH